MRAMKTLLLALTFLPALAVAHDYTIGDLTIQHPWTRATAPKATTAAGYVTITNHGTAPETLTAATMAGAGHSMLHRTQTEQGVASMVHQNNITIPAGATVKLEPGSYHIMAMQLTEGYKAGDTISGTLTFDKAGTLPVGFKVEAMGAQTPQTPQADESSAPHDHH